MQKSFLAVYNSECILVAHVSTHWKSTGTRLTTSSGVCFAIDSCAGTTIYPHPRPSSQTWNPSPTVPAGPCPDPHPSPHKLLSSPSPLPYTQPVPHLSPTSNIAETCQNPKVLIRHKKNDNATLWNRAKFSRWCNFDWRVTRKTLGGNVEWLQRGYDFKQQTSLPICCVLNCIDYHEITADNQLHYRGSPQQGAPSPRCYCSEKSI